MLAALFLLLGPSFASQAQMAGGTSSSACPAPRVVELCVELVGCYPLPRFA
jgi:hypothetical protein